MVGLWLSFARLNRSVAMSVWAVFVLSACGASPRMVHQSAHYFERCHAADLDTQRTVDDRQGCWAAWLRHWADDQPPVRVRYAEQRLVALSRGEAMQPLSDEGLAARADATQPSLTAHVLVETGDGAGPPRVEVTEGEAEEAEIAELPAVGATSSTEPLQPTSAEGSDGAAVASAEPRSPITPPTAPPVRPPVREQVPMPPPAAPVRLGTHPCSEHCNPQWDLCVRRCDRRGQPCMDACRSEYRICLGVCR